MYSEKVMDHFSHPRNVGELADANAIGQVGNPKCGDIMKIYMKISPSGVIEDISFKTFGCGAAIATSSMAKIQITPITSAARIPIHTARESSFFSFSSLPET